MLYLMLALGFVKISSAVPMPNFDICARYSIWLSPAQERDLKPYNDFFIKPYQIDRSVEGAEKMSFDLPPELTSGEKFKVVLTVVSHVGANREFAGDAGTASCQGPWKRMTCSFHLKGIKFDLAKTKQYISEKYADPEQREGLIQIARLSGGDPIGVATMSPRDARCFAPFRDQ